MNHGAIRHPQNTRSTKVKRTQDYNNTDKVHTTWRRDRLTTAAMEKQVVFNPLNAELNTICYLLA
jgi:hypothetical protein